ncbi:MAG: DUF2977 domain-containing protein [Ruminococcus sp.]|nr:DUF2977 domain-containing protein [Ruminococcus sp.]
MKILIDENGVVRAWQVVGSGFGETNYTTVRVDKIPEEVRENPRKYCYIEGEYVDNPDYAEPAKQLSELDKLALAVAELAEIIAGGV